MTTSLAKMISAILHPLLVPTYALLIMINLQTHSILALPVNFRYIIVGIVFLATFVIPSIIIFLLLKLKRINSLQMDTRQERVLPMIIIAISFYTTYYLLKQTSITGIMTLFMVGATMLVLIALIVNYITKISLHLTALGGVFGTFLGMAIIFHFDLSILLYIIIFVIGIVASARLKLNAHTPLQVYGGFLLGAGVMLLLFYIV